MTGCSEEAHNAVWAAFHKNPFQEIYIPRRALEEVIACHDRFDPKYDTLGIPARTVQKTAKEIPCKRDALFKFLVAHGDCRCDVKRAE